MSNSPDLDALALLIAKKLNDDAAYLELTLDDWRIEFARRLRAAWERDAVPVAWCCEWSSGEKSVATFKQSWWEVGWHTGSGLEIISVYPLYAHPPAADSAQALESLRPAIGFMEPPE